MSDDKELEKDELFKEEEILDHDYDGIKELNNGMPFWLSSLFIISIIFGCLYYIHYTSKSGPTLLQEFITDKAEYLALREKLNSSKDSEDWLHSLKPEEALIIGKAAFESKCAACHAKDGGGGIGPNLTDDSWIHGNASIEDIQQVIAEGVLEKGMPAWAQVLSKKDLAAITIFVKSLAGTKPETAKEAQGSLIN